MANSEMTQFLDHF